MGYKALNENKVPDDEVDIKALFIFFWRKKLMIFFITFSFVIGFIFLVLNLPNIYKAEALLYPSEDQQSGGLAALAGQLGGLAGLAGINVGAGSGTNKTKLALEVLQSRGFIASFIKKHNILKDLMAVQSWQQTENELVYNSEIYDIDSATWVRKVSFPYEAKPSDQEAYKVFIEQLEVIEDKDSGMIKVSIEHLSPFVAKNWVDLIIQDLNSQMMYREVAEAQKSKDFLTQRLNETDVFDMKTVLYKLLEEQAKIIMFANVRDEYAFKTIDPAVVPETKSKPRRVIILILGFMLGLFVAVFSVSIMYLFKPKGQ